jgi:cysteinyl-tRNA synthetase
MVSGKKSPTDFALWKLTSPGVKRQMEWSSPWGRGFPGWHTECVVMSQKTLGVPFDIHFGGIDHILIHHTNEIAQSDAAFEKPLARFWLHGEFLNLKQGRMGKSKGNIITIQSLIEKKLNPLAFRYLCLTAHYRSKLNFSWTTIKGAQRGLDNLYQKVRAIKTDIKKGEIKQFKPEELKINKKIKKYQSRFLSFINDDLDLPKALALMWQLIKDEKIANKEKYALLLGFDTVLGLGLDKIKKEKIPKEILELVKKREEERQKKDWLKTDKIRVKIKQMGYLVEDTKQGPKVKKL